ncbi:MAG TPA: cation-transporting P-type ATPase [Anaerolineales bacterium]
MESTPLHSLRVSEVYKAMETSPEGLTSSEADARRSLYGNNLLSEQPRSPLWHKFIAHTLHWLALILWIAGLLAFLVREPVLGVVIWIVILINAVFSFWREYRAEQALVALRKLLPSYARLVRDGMEVQIPSSEVVPGDILVLAEGDNIPADARVVEEYGLRTNNATLTGEAVPARKTSDASIREGISEVERPNLVFAGTSVVSGTGRAVVYANGMLTQFGRIAHLTQAVKEEPNPLQVELIRVTRIISFAAIGIGVVVFVVGAFDPTVGLGKFEAFILAIGILVAAVPEGLPATITLSLAMAAQRLAQRGVLVKKLAIIETLGTISVICTDKSGTLTQNQMTVREVWVGGQRISLSGVGYEPQGEYSPDPSGQLYEGDLQALLQAATLCNNSRLNPPTPEHPQWTSLGDQTEAALRVAALKGGINERALGATLPRVHELPFDARRKRMSTIHRDQPNGASGRQIAYVKGAPREVLQLCTQILIGGEVCPLDSATRAQILAANDDFARNALRVLALARRDLPPRSGTYLPENVEQNLTFLGLMAMMDPPRPEVAEAVKVCQRAGIRIVMITGDYGLTAESLARRVGMLTTPNPRILTGVDLDELNDIELQATIKDEVIFARMAPEHKLRLVAAFQGRGDVVAVTGDGVNDAPALRKADVGIAMGLIGTDVAKEAADIILTNDNFGLIVSAIEEGRAVFDNLRKFITYIFSSNVPEILPFILTAMFKIPLALTVRQILAIDLGTDLFPSLALGTEKPEPNVMRRPPRRRNQPLIDSGLLWRAYLFLGLIEAALCYTGFFLVYKFLGSPGVNALPLLQLLHETGGAALSSDQVGILAITVFHAGVVTAQIGNAFACRSERLRGRYLGWLSNRQLLLAVAAEIVIILLLIYFPPLARAFSHVPLPPIYWAGLILYAPILYTLDWIRKSFLRKIERRQANGATTQEVTADQDNQISSEEGDNTP